MNTNTVNRFCELGQSPTTTRTTISRYAATDRCPSSSISRSVANISSPMQSTDETAPSPLHSFGTRPHYDWPPSDALMDLMNLDLSALWIFLSIHEMFTYETGTPYLERYSTMLRDVRRLLIHTLPLDEFQQTLIQQTAARKATREATIDRRQRRRFTSGTSATSNAAFSNGSNQQFFRPDPPSQQGGFISNNSSNFRPNNNNKITNPFRQ
ncbi:hypothetical protein BD408DRAFT_433176 [Parasitella parasitica]|nr:hypothetical protein BD408DRAFT_433176 [Parasitella parasitica]